MNVAAVRFRSVLAVLVGAIAALPAAKGDDLGARLHTLLSRYEGYGFSGVVLVAKDGRVVLHEGYGMADRERGLRNTTATRFEIGSLTKTFTAAAILQLEAAGKLETDDPIERYLGPFPESKAAATIHHLATHTAGLVPEGYDLPYDDDRERFVRSMKDAPRESAPGERYRYTNAGYSLLAVIVERVSGLSYETYVRERLFAPAGLSEAGFRNDAGAGTTRLARGYLGSPAEVKIGPPASWPWGTRGAGGVVAAVHDVYRWYLALKTDRVLPAKASEKMFHPWPQEGYGWHVGKDEKGRNVIQKGGGMPNFAAHLLHYPDQKVVIAWASNDLTQRWRKTLNRSLAAASLGDEYVLPPAVRKIEPDALAKYAGRYSTPAGETVEIKASAGHLYAEPNPLGIPHDVSFFFQDRDRFTGIRTTDALTVSLRFRRGADGEVRKMIFPGKARKVVGERAR